MKKKYLSLCFLAALALVISASLLASPKIGKHPAHRGKTCAFCHEQAGFSKAKKGYDRNGSEYKKIGKNRLCAGPECHN
ncbi:MAG: hypothetical protein FWG13_01970 [Leptospirales bacterium]|nr:hypothetical protein [Leptospirales bacterium]